MHPWQLISPFALVVLQPLLPHAQAQNRPLVPRGARLDRVIVSGTNCRQGQFADEQKAFDNLVDGYLKLPPGTLDVDTREVPGGFGGPGNGTERTCQLRFSMWDIQAGWQYSFESASFIDSAYITGQSRIAVEVAAQAGDAEPV